jgi:hypothetical protein
VIAHGVDGAESIIEYESRGGEAEGPGWRNPGHQDKKGKIAKRDTQKGGYRSDKFVSKYAATITRREEN